MTIIEARKASRDELLAAYEKLADAHDRLTEIFDQVASVGYCHHCARKFEMANVEPEEFNPDED